MEDVWFSGGECVTVCDGCQGVVEFGTYETAEAAITALSEIGKCPHCNASWSSHTNLGQGLPEEGVTEVQRRKALQDGQVH